MRRSAAAIVFSAACCFSASPVFADDPPELFFISMRVPNLDPAPRFVSVYQDATDSMTEPVAGCDGNTYYATPDDASVIAAALTNGNSVELASGAPGTAPQDAGVVCIIQSAS